MTFPLLDSSSIEQKSMGNKRSSQQPVENTPVAKRFRNDQASKTEGGTSSSSEMEVDEQQPAEPARENCATQPQQPNVSSHLPNRSSAFH